MPRCNGSYIGIDANPNANVASGIWTVREAETLLRANQWPATPTVPGAPAGTARNEQVALTWTAPTGGSTPTDYEVQYSSNGGSTWTTFSDGVSAATSATVTGLTNGTGYIFRVRAVNILGDGPYGSASGTITPNNTAILILNFNGSDGSTTFTDTSGFSQTVTATGNAELDTGEKKFGSASMQLTAGSALVTDNSDFDMTGQAFCFEAWLYTTSDGEQSIFNRVVGEGASGFSLQRLQGGEVLFSFGDSWNAGGNIPLNQWVHVAATYDGTTRRLFIDGVLIGSNSSGEWSNEDTDLAIGHRPTDIREFYWEGWIDSVRVSRGDAVYTSEFTPPTTEF